MAEIDLYQLEHLNSIIYSPDRINSTFTRVTLSLSSVGVALSGWALILLLITACLFQEWRKSYKNQLLIQFMVARCGYTFVRYFFDIRTIFSICGGNSCIIYMDEWLMIYTEIVLVAWMFIFSRQMYDSLVKVFSPKSTNIWKVSLTTWVTPVIITILMHALYKWQEGNDLMVFFLYLAILKWPLLVANAVILTMTLKSLTKSNKTKVNSPSTNTRLVVVMSFLIFFFCFQQAFVDIYKLIYIAFDHPSFLLILVNLMTMFHCAFAIMFWVFGNAKTRKMWRNRFCCESKTPLSPQSSLDSNK